MNRLILASVAVLGCLAAAWAEDTGVPALDNRSADWKKNLVLAVNDASKVKPAIQAVPEASRAAFAADVLAVLLTKRQHMADQQAWVNDFGVTAAALADGSGGVTNAVLATVAGEVVIACVTAESRELGNGDVPELGVLSKSVVSSLKNENRVAFANAVLLAVGKQKAADAGVRKLALCAASLALFAGAGDAKSGVFAEVFAVVEVGDLGSETKAFADAFNQRKNNLSNDDYLQVALQILQTVAARIAGQPDATTRFAYAVAVFLGGANNPAAFEQALSGKLADLLVKIGATKEGFAAALALVKPDVATNAALVESLYPSLTQKAVWGVIILPPGSMLAGEEGPPFLHENRPPSNLSTGYQDQKIEALTTKPGCPGSGWLPYR